MNKLDKIRQILVCGAGLRDRCAPRSAVTAVLALALSLAAGSAPAGPPTAIMRASLPGDARSAPFLLARSPYSLEQTVDRVKAAARGQNFRFIREQSLDHGFVSPGSENDRRRIIYLCDFGFLDKALKIDPHIGMFLPCQVNVIQSRTGVYIVAPNPKVVSEEFFNNPELHSACERLHQSYVGILDEATM